MFSPKQLIKFEDSGGLLTNLAPSDVDAISTFFDMNNPDEVQLFNAVKEHSIAAQKLHDILKAFKEKYA